MPQAVKDLSVQLQLDLAPYRKGLEAMVGATREAAAQAGAQMAAGLTGVNAPTVDLSGVHRILDEARADFERLRTTAAQPIQIPTPQLPPPIVLPPVEVPPVVIPPPDTKPFAVVKAEVRAMLDQPFSQLETTLDEVRRAKLALDRELQSAATGAARREVGQLAGELELLEERMRSASRAPRPSDAGDERRGGGIVDMAVGVVAGNAISAAMGAVSQGFEAAAESGATMEQQMADLSAITGIAGDDLADLGDAARQSALDSGVAANQQAEAYKLLASNIDIATMGGIEGLEKMGEEVVTLSVAAQTDLKTAAEATAGAINQFGLEADQATRVVNLLAAGAKKGGAEVPDLAESLKITGAAAAGAGLTIEQTVAALEVMSGAMIKGSEAGTSFRGTLGVLQEKAEKFKEAGLGTIDLAANGLEATLRQLAPLLQDQGKLIGLFGNENQVAAQYLIANVDALDGMTESITGTNTATEQAEIQMATLQGSVALLKTALTELALNGFDGLGGAAAAAVNGLRESVLWLDRNWDSVTTGVKVLALAAIAYGSYRTAALLSAAASAAHTVATTAAGIAGIVMAGETGVATAAMVAFNAVVAANPIGILLVVLGTAVGAWALFGDAAETAGERTERAMNRARTAAQEARAAIIAATDERLNQMGRGAQAETRMIEADIAEAEVQLQQLRTRFVGMGQAGERQEQIRLQEERLVTLRAELAGARERLRIMGEEKERRDTQTPTPTPTPAPAVATPAAATRAPKAKTPDGPTPEQLEEQRRQAAMREVEMGEAVVIARRDAEAEADRHRRALTEQRLRDAHRETEERARLMDDELEGQRLVLQSTGMVQAEQHRLRLEEIADEGGAAKSAAQDRYDAEVRRIDGERAATARNASEQAAVDAAAAERDLAKTAAQHHVLEQLVEADQDLADQRARNAEDARRIDEAQIARTRTMMEQRSADVARATEQLRKYLAEVRASAEAQVAAARQIVGAFAQAATANIRLPFLDQWEEQSRMSDEQVDDERERFRQQEADLRDSLDRRETTQQEAAARLREIREQEAAFERKLNQERESVFVKGLRASLREGLNQVTTYLKKRATQYAVEVLLHSSAETAKTASTEAGTIARLISGAAEIAGDLAKGAASMVSAAAKWIADAVSKFGIFSLAAIPVGVAGLYGAYKGAKSLFGFRSGGYTGDGDPSEVAGDVHRNEIVLESGIVRGQVSDVMALRALLQSGVRAADIVALAGAPDMASLGAAFSAASPVAAFTAPVAAPSASAAAPDLSGIERQFARLADEVLEAKRNPVPVYTTPKQQRLAESAAARDRSRSAPSRVRRITVERR